jgi:mono/diheme cytochrome c family protein
MGVALGGKLCTTLKGLKEMRSDKYQLTLISLGLVATAFFAVFLYREAFPEYKIYQKDYLSLENFRSKYTGDAPPDFSIGVKQIIQTREDKGPAKVDRCISCHVALNFPHFSATKIAHDTDGNMILGVDGIPKQIPNENDIWTKLETEILKLEKENKLTEAKNLRALKTAHVKGKTYDVTKVLRMHPLMGKETRPFEFHPIDEYGCTSCHNGNGLGLTTEKAHGPLFDGDYEIEFEGPVPKFTESDVLNDPKFARAYNGKPGHELLFQTSPLFVGALIQAKCMQCHQSTEDTLKTGNANFSILTTKQQHQQALLQKSFNESESTLFTLLKLKKEIEALGVATTVEKLKENSKNYSLSDEERTKIQANINFLLMTVGGSDGLLEQNSQPAKDVILQKIDEQLKELLGSHELIEKIDLLSVDGTGEIVNQFLIENKSEKGASGSLFQKLKKLSDESNDINTSIENPGKVTSDIDLLTKNFHRGKNLYISQACYACHRIAGNARGGVGPELTEIGKGYPWYIKQKVVWPQSTLRNSTMPNYHLDHHELEDLMTYLLAQTGKNSSVADSVKRNQIKEWEAGQKTELEKPISPSDIHNLDNSMIIFATEGCAACHRLKGYTSNVGFEIEKHDTTFNDLFKTREWFQQLIPEAIAGSTLVKVLETNAQEIDKRIVSDVRKDSLLEKIEEAYPVTLESFYTEFRFAARAKNHELKMDAEKETDSGRKQEKLDALKAWNARVKRVLLMYIQEYGLGRQIGPKLNWSGVYRSDEWLMQHFRNPTALIPNSIMPIFPFDDTKFYALTNMLNVLGQKNRDSTRAIWNHIGFNPEMAYEIHCAQCHGNYLGGNGPVAEWIYPIPKNLRNADFLRNLTKANAAHSIIHGVKGTPMAPWGEVAKDKEKSDGIPVLTADEIQHMVDWIYSKVPGDNVIDDSKGIPKWNYDIKNIHKELNDAGSVLESNSEQVNETEDAIFDVQINKSMDMPQKSYFIKKKYYTLQNIQAGQEFFVKNCAVCHGKEADGTGARGAIMQDAKPRNLLNMEWISSRDDLRLLRSIKYGIHGTSMSAWGELTSGLQRLQLVMFIRNLSQESGMRSLLKAALYESFDSSVFVVENARSTEYGKINDLQKKISELKTKNVDEAQAIENFKEKLKLEKELTLGREKDKVLINIQTSLKEQNLKMQQIGFELIGRHVSEELFNIYLSLIALNKNRYEIHEGKIKIAQDDKVKYQMILKRDQMIKLLDASIEELKREYAITDREGDSDAKKEHLSGLQSEIKAYEKLKNTLYSGIKKIIELMEKQEKVMINDEI